MSQKSCPKTSEEKEQMNKIPYLRTVGILIYDMICTRPDIYHAVRMASRYQSNLGQAHWKSVKRILRFLKGITGYSLCYHGNDLRLTGYTDVD